MGSSFSGNDAVPSRWSTSPGCSPPALPGPLSKTAVTAIPPPLGSGLPLAPNNPRLKSSAPAPGSPGGTCRQSPSTATTQAPTRARLCHAQQPLGDLDGVERGALAELVAAGEEAERGTRRRAHAQPSHQH